VAIDCERNNPIRAHRQSVRFLQQFEKIFDPATLRDEFSVLLSPTSNIRGRCMSIEGVLLIVILTFAIGHLLNRLDTGRSRIRRPGGRD
jgi:hypothetical protein